MDQPIVSLRLLGDLRLSANGKPRLFATRKAESLFAYLVLAGGRPVTREKAYGALWPDAEESRARGMLSTALWRVRKTISELGISISTKGGWLSLDAPALEVDALQFKQLAEASTSNPEARLANVEKAVSLYGGDLLESVDEAWCDLDRAHFRTMHLSLLKELVAACRERAVYPKAIELARKVVQQDPMDEDAHRELMLLFHLEGNRSAALAQYQVLHNTLHAELGISPERKTTDLWRYIRSRAGGAVVDRPSIAGPAWTAVEYASTNPIVGRDNELGRILEGLNCALHGRGSIFVLSGEAGVGKTRLVEATEVEAELRGFEVLKGRCTDVRDPAPYQAFIEAVWPRISRKMQADTPQILHDFLARLSPAMRRLRPSPRTDDAETAIFNETLLGILNGETPVLLVLEDFQHSDQATKNLIHLLANRVGGRKMTALLSIRLLLPRRRLGRGVLALRAATEVRLTPLDRSQTHDLVRSRLRSRSVAASVLSLIWDRTAGSPLAIVEYVRFLAERSYIVSTGDSYWTWADSSLVLAQMPRRVQVLFRERIDALKGEAREVLLTAAVLGYEGDLLLLEKLSGLETPRLTEVINELFDHSLLVETERGYRFSHEGYRLATLSAITGASRRLLHKRAADMMERLWPARSEDLSWHFLEAGEHSKAMTYAEAAGDKAKAVHANANALKWYSKAIELLPSIEGHPDKEHRFSLLFKRQEVLGLLGHSRPQLGDLDEIVDHARLKDDRYLLALCQCLRAHALSRMNRNAEGLRAATAARQVYSTLNDARGQARAFEGAALVFMNLRDARRVREAYQKALDLSHSAGDDQGAARAILGIGTLMLFTGRNKEGLRHLEHAEAMLARSPDKRAYARALLQKGVFCRCLGQTEKSERLLIQGVDLMREQGDRVGEARGLSQLAYTHMTQGLLRKALHEARQSIQLATEVGDTRGQIVFRNNAAYAVYRRLGDFGRAQRCVRKAISLVRTAGRKENEAIYYDTMAAILCDQGQYSAAHQWASASQRLYKRWSGQFDYVGAEIEFHLGSAALALGKIDEARECLSHAVGHWHRSHDKALLARGLGLLGLAALAEGKVEEAVQCANRSARLLRQCKGVEEIQHTYWSHATIFEAAGLDKASTRAMERAYVIVTRQASLLKGRLRGMFLAIPANRRIVEEHDSAKSVGRSAIRRGTDSFRETLIVKTRTQSTDKVMERRERLLGLIRNGGLRRRALAEALGVSERTVRSDIVTLRYLGMIP